MKPTSILRHTPNNVPDPMASSTSTLMVHAFVFVSRNNQQACTFFHRIAGTNTASSSVSFPSPASWEERDAVFYRYSR
jgi:hypothetical protein